jgi:hypothetical protein
VDALHFVLEDKSYWLGRDATGKYYAVIARRVLATALQEGWSFLSLLTQAASYLRQYGRAPGLHTLIKKAIQNVTPQEATDFVMMLAEWHKVGLLRWTDETKQYVVLALHRTAEPWRRAVKPRSSLASLKHVEVSVEVSAAGACA